MIFFLIWLSDICHGHNQLRVLKRRMGLANTKPQTPNTKHQTKSLLLLRFHYHPQIFPAIYHYAQWIIESYMADDLVFIKSGLFIQEVKIIKAIFNKRINGEVSHPERGKVLEEMGSLTGIDSVTVEP